MCKYCNDEERKILTPKMPDSKSDIKSPQLTLKITMDPSLYINIFFWDELRSTYMGAACAPSINYCPWCGRKLTKD